jgi:hypothetical protein
VSRGTLALIVFVITGTLIVSEAALRRWFDPTLPTPSAALWISAASLAISIVTFYLLAIRGPDVTIHQLTGARYNKELSSWLADGSFRAVIECRLLIANEGRRAGVLHTLAFGTPTFEPHSPRILSADAHGPHGDDGNEIRAPLVVQDGALLSAVVSIELAVSDRDNDYQHRCANDLRELKSVSVPFIYSFGRHGSLRQRRGSASAPLEEVRAAALENWKGMPSAKLGYRILAEGREE